VDVRRKPLAHLGQRRPRVRKSRSTPLLTSRSAPSYSSSQLKRATFARSPPPLPPIGPSSGGWSGRLGTRQRLSAHVPSRSHRIRRATYWRPANIRGHCVTLA
jgi:hypothetical protein